MDPLSDVLALLKPRSYVSAGFDAGGPWCVAFGAYEGIKFNAVVSGQCWLAVDGVAEPVRLRAGDCFLLTGGRPFRIGSDLALPPLAAEHVFSAPRVRGVVTIHGGGDMFMLGSRFSLAGPHAALLDGLLPPVVHIRNETEQAALRWSLDRMRRELRDPQPGSHLVAQHLAHMMLVQALRLHLTEPAAGQVGWLFALADRQLGAAIGRMHEDPARRWTVRELAESAGMSRSAFALRFTTAVGEPPLAYLTRWRMLLAADRLHRGGEPVGEIALSLGYGSESAFSTAFKRVMGCAPRQYGRAAAPRRAGYATSRQPVAA